MQSFGTVEQSALQSIPKKSAKKKKSTSQEEFIYVKPLAPLSDEEVLKCANLDFDIIISLPYGAKSTANKIPDALYVASIIDMIQKRIQNRLQNVGKSIGKVNVIVVGSLCRYDYFLKFSEDIDKLLPDIVKNHGAKILEMNEQKGSAKLIASFMGELLYDAAIAKEKQFLEYYKTELAKLIDQRTLKINYLGFHDIETQSLYAEKTKAIQQAFPKPTDSFHTTIDRVAIEFVEQKGNTHKTNFTLDDKEFPAEESKLKKVITALEKYLKIQWVPIFIEGSKLYTTKEAPTFLIRVGKAVYGKSVMQNIFTDIFAMNPGYEFFQIKSGPKKPEVFGESPIYIKKNNEFKIFYPENKPSVTSTKKMFDLMQVSPKRVECIPESIYLEMKDGKDLSPTEHFDGKYFDHGFFQSNYVAQLKEILDANQYSLNLLPYSPIIENLIQNNLKLQYYCYLRSLQQFPASEPSSQVRMVR